MKIGITYYELYDPKAKLYLRHMVASKAWCWRHDPDWKPRWVTADDLYLTSPGMSRYTAEAQWQVYEFQRLEYRPNLPKLIIRKIVFSAVAKSTGWVNTELKPMDRMIRRIGRKHGVIIVNALEKLQTNEQPIWAMKRKGKTQALVKDTLPDTILHSGQYMFFYNRDDIVLAKIALGPNIATEYDLGKYACS